MRRVSEAERALLTHISMFGSDGYPVHKSGRRGWTWGTDAVKGPPTIFRRKRDAVDSFEAFLGVLREALGEEARERALACEPSSERFAKLYGLHALDCGHGCGGSFVCERCGERFGWCMQGADKNARRCTHCYRVLVLAGRP